MARERTLAIVKPDAVQRNLIGEIIRRIEAERPPGGGGALSPPQPRPTRRASTPSIASGRSSASLVEYMCSGPVMVLALEGDDAIKRWRDLMGATDPAKADPGTIRKDLGQSVEANATHGSDAPETARDRDRVLLPQPRGRRARVDGRAGVPARRVRQRAVSSSAPRSGRPPGADAAATRACSSSPSLLVYWLTSPGATAYDQYALLAERAPARQPLAAGAAAAPRDGGVRTGAPTSRNPPTPALLLAPFLWIAEREPLRTWLVSQERRVEPAVRALPDRALDPLRRAPRSRSRGSRSVAFRCRAAPPTGARSSSDSAPSIGTTRRSARSGTSRRSSTACSCGCSSSSGSGRARPALMGTCARVRVLVPHGDASSRCRSCWSRCPDRWLQPRTDEIIPRPRFGWLVRVRAADRRACWR